MRALRLALLSLVLTLGPSACAETVDLHDAEVGEFGGGDCRRGTAPGTANCSHCEVETFFEIHAASREGASYVFPTSCIPPNFEDCIETDDAAILDACDRFCETHPESRSSYCAR